MSFDELAWAAGLFEGEGCLTTSVGGSGLPLIRLQLAMTDEDTVRRFHKAVGGLGTIRFIDRKRPDRQNLWSWQTSQFEHAQAVVAMLWSGLGTRRRGRATELFTTIKLGQGSRVRNRYQKYKIVV